MVQCIFWWVGQAHLAHDFWWFSFLLQLRKRQSNYLELLRFISPKQERKRAKSKLITKN